MPLVSVTVEVPWLTQVKSALAGGVKRWKGSMSQADPLSWFSRPSVGM